MAMVFGGVVPYIPQYIQIKQKQTTQVPTKNYVAGTGTSTLFLNEFFNVVV